MMERPRRRALPRAAKKLDHTRREENASGCRVVVNDGEEDDDIIKVLSCTRLSLSLSRFLVKVFLLLQRGARSLRAIQHSDALRAHRTFSTVFADLRWRSLVEVDANIRLFDV